MALQFDSIEPVEAEKAAPMIKKDTDCVCELTGKIVGIEQDADLPLTKCTFVHFIPDGKTEACTLRLAAFTNMPQLIKNLTEAIEESV